MPSLVAWHLQGGPHPAVGVQQGRGVAVAVGVDPDDGVNPALEHGHGGCSFQDGDHWLAPAWVGVTTRRQDCEGSRPRADRLLHQASDDGGPGRCRQLEDRSAARHASRRPARTGVTLPAGASLSVPRPGTKDSITARTTASARSTIISRPSGSLRDVDQEGWRRLRACGGRRYLPSFHHGPGGCLSELREVDRPAGGCVDLQFGCPLAGVVVHSTRMLRGPSATLVRQRGVVVDPVPASR
jgi:hypothetical protein